MPYPPRLLLVVCIISTVCRSSGFLASLPMKMRPQALSSQGVATRHGAQRVALLKMQDKGGGMFGNMWEKVMLKLVEVKEKEGAKKKLQECVFCVKGNLKCDGCEGTGKDIAMGGKSACFICNGKGSRMCSVCGGIGMVDKVRRGGTDTAGAWIGKEKEAMDPLIPQYEPFILELDEAKRYVWCQCGVSMKQPFCDGNSHRAYGIKPVPFTTRGTEGGRSKVNLCGCKYTNTPPYCDGTHVSLKAQAEAGGTV
mmetsp:Transcript_72688/g.106557  ORF Transcript_72688/g.106557 Transcript_72688/m.106557 type:complete len:253 (-) Transcript_72688:160-918(-)